MQGGTCQELSPYIVSSVNAGSPGKQLLDDLKLANACCLVERRSSILQAQRRPVTARMLSVAPVLSAPAARPPPSARACLPEARAAGSAFRKCTT